MKKLVYTIFLFSLPIFGQVTLIPDSNFEMFLISEGIDTDGIVNGQVFTVDIEDELALDIDMFGIVDLTGIEDFESLEVLDLFQMPISDIDLSQNVNLRELRIDDISINSFDLSNNINLEYIALALNYSSSAYNSSLSELDISNNLLLNHLTITSTNITTLDISNNVNLDYFVAFSMSELQAIDLKNGSNEIITFLQITNPLSLTCLQVDDPAAVIAGTNPPYDNWIIEGAPIISDDCYLGLAEFAKSEVVIYPNPITNDILNVYFDESMSIQTMSLHDSYGKLVFKSPYSNTIDLTSVVSGVYILTLESEEKVISFKVVK